MTRAAVVLVTLIVYQLLMLAIGFIAQRMTRDESDFLLGGRKLGALVAAISASASSSSVWTLLGVSGYAYDKGLQAVWLFPACVGGFALNWWVVAPRIRRASVETGALTVTDLCAGRWRGPGFGVVRWAATLILLFSLTAYVASQFLGAGKSFQASFETDFTEAVLIGSVVVVTYTILGGFWAVSLTDTFQGLMMAGAAVVMPVAALIAVGGPAALIEGIRRTEVAGFGSLSAGLDGGPAVLGIVALLGIGIGYPGQPHVVNRFMATRDERSLVRARRYAMAWAVVVYAGMIVLGLCARVLHETPLGDHEKTFFAMADELFPPVVSGLILAAVLSAIMSTADSQLLVSASSVSHDLGWRGPDERAQLLRSRLVVLGVSAVAVALALSGSKEIFSSVLFAWSALGAAFGPLLLVTLWRGPVGPLRSLWSMIAGFALSVVAYSVEGWKDGVMERVVPFLVAGVILLAPGRARTVRE